MHTENGRLDYHRHKIFSWIKEGIWENNVIASEGLVSSGGAKELEGSKEITSGSALSLLVFPGAEFHNQAITKMAQTYRDEFSQGYHYLDYPSQKEKGAFIVGWWNVINRIYCGGNGEDIARLIGYKKV